MQRDLRQHRNANVKKITKMCTRKVLKAKVQIKTQSDAKQPQKIQNKKLSAKK